MSAHRFLVHAEWRERTKFQLVGTERDETVTILARNFMDALWKAQRRFRGARISIQDLDSAPSGKGAPGGG